MNEPTGSPLPYRVFYAGRVRDELMLLIGRTKNRGLGRDVLDALKEIDYRLRIYSSVNPFGI
jgi:hypothetical protein